MRRLASTLLCIVLFAHVLLGPPAEAARTYVNGDEVVYVTRTGECYHRGYCSYLRSKIEKTLEQAVNSGYRACSRCNPPRLLAATPTPRPTPTQKPTPKPTPRPTPTLKPTTTHDLKIPINGDAANDTLSSGAKVILEYNDKRNGSTAKPSTTPGTISTQQSANENSKRDSDRTFSVVVSISWFILMLFFYERTKNKK